MISLGLLGKNIKHSKSAEIYRKLLTQKLNYQHYDFSDSKDIPSLDKIFSEVQGLSITSPYKTHFLEDVEVESECVELLAVNTIGKFGNNYKATNTDYLAIKEVLQRLLRENGKLFVAILGDGAMSRVTSIILERENIPYNIFSRKLNSNFSNLDLPHELKDHSDQVLVINSCAREFVFSGVLSPHYLFWDYNYNFRPHADDIPTKVKTYFDGLEMLELQAKYALKFWCLG